MILTRFVQAPTPRSIKKLYNSKKFLTTINVACRSIQRLQEKGLPLSHHVQGSPLTSVIAEYGAPGGK